MAKSCEVDKYEPSCSLLSFSTCAGFSVTWNRVPALLVIVRLLLCCGVHRLIEFVCVVKGFFVVLILWAVGVWLGVIVYYCVFAVCDVLSVEACSV